MTIRSSAFVHEGVIPSAYTCNGSGISVPLEFADVPKDAVSLALIMDDPDVPLSARADGLWNHWVVWNMPPTTTEIPEGGVVPGAEGLTTGDTRGYYPPCPPDREHRYFFRLYALDTLLTLNENATREDMERAMNGHVIQQTELMGRYVQ